MRIYRVTILPHAEGRNACNLVYQGRLEKEVLEALQRKTNIPKAVNSQPWKN